MVNEDYPSAPSCFADRGRAKRKVIARKYNKKIQLRELEQQIERVELDHASYLEIELEYLKELVAYYHEKHLALETFVIEKLKMQENR